MNRHPLRFAGLIAIIVALLAGPAAAQGADQASGTLVLEGVDATGFPLIRAVVSGPTLQGDLDEAFVLTEDGEELTADVVRLRGDGLNVVVALDVSGSMEGEPLERAKAAVGALLETLPDTVPVSIVSFGDTANVQSTFTTDRDATRGAVDSLIAAGQTALFDGVQLGLAQLAAQGGSSALVVLADGADSVSAATIEDATANLGSADAKVSFVALETRDFNAESFQAMATAAGGSVLTVDEAAKFSEAMRDVAAGLSNYYEIRWRSASTDESADLAIALASDPAQSITSTFAHAAVAQFVPDVATETRTVGGAGLFAASWIPMVAALFVTAGGAVLIWMMRNSEGAIERREERANSGRHADKAKAARGKDARNALSGMQDALTDLSGKVLEGNNRGRTLDDKLDRAGLAIRSNEFVAFCAVFTVGCLLFGVVLFGVPFFLLAGLFPALGIPFFLKFKTKRRRKAFVDQLGDTLQLIVGSLTAGYGLGQTLDSVAREADSPTAEEFGRVVMETRIGRSLEDALDAMSERLQAPDFDWVVDAIKIQSSVGGNLSEIIEQVGETIRARVRIKRQIDALTAEGKISALVLFVLPFGLFGFIFSSNPDYIMPMFSQGIGYVLMGVAGFMLLCGGLWLKKLVNPEF